MSGAAGRDELGCDNPVLYLSSVCFFLSFGKTLNLSESQFQLGKGMADIYPLCFGKD